MKLLGTTLVALVAFSVGCASRPTAASAPSDTRDAAPREVDQALADEHEGADVAAAVAPELSDARVVGDYVTFAFSGAYRKGPLKLTQRVVAKAADTITIDYTFAEAKKTETLRVAYSTADKTRGDILDVTSIDAKGASKASSRAAFETKMAETAAMTDQNEGLSDERALTVKVGQTDVPAKRSTYKVRIGQKAATLETTASEAFAWGDLGGKITTADGKVFFHAEIVDAGGPASARASLE
jgi:hypothetical protein